MTQGTNKADWNLFDFDAFSNYVSTALQIAIYIGFRHHMPCYSGEGHWYVKPCTFERELVIPYFTQLIQSHADCFTNNILKSSRWRLSPTSWRISR